MGKFIWWTTWLALNPRQRARHRRGSLNPRNQPRVTACNIYFPKPTSNLKVYMTARLGNHEEDAGKRENGWAQCYSSEVCNYNGLWRNETEVLWTQWSKVSAWSNNSHLIEQHIMQGWWKSTASQFICFAAKMQATEYRWHLGFVWLSRSRPASLHIKHQVGYFWEWTRAQLPNKHLLELSCEKQALARS